MRKTGLTIILLLLCISIGYGQDDKPLSTKVYYKFSHKGNIYSFGGKFPVNNNTNCIMDAIYDFDHLKKFMLDVDSVELIRKDSNYYEVRYSYHKLFLKAKTTFRRVLNKEQRIVTSEMIGHDQNSILFPKPLASHGYYRIKEDKTGCWFEYFRECEIEPKSLDGLYFYIAEKEAINHLYTIKEYIEKTCP